MKLFFCLVAGLFIFLPSFSQTVSGGASLCGGSSEVLTVSGVTASDTYHWQSSSDGTNWTDISNTDNQTTHTVTTVGYYRIIITSNNNKPSNSFQVIDSPKPDATFSFTPNNQCSNTPVIFTDVSTSGATYAWNFGDINSGGANTFSAENPSHTFIGITGNNTQNFSVQLTVTSKDGCVTSSNKLVTTKQLPDATLGGTGAIFYDNKNYFKSCSSTATTANFTFTNQSGTTNTSYKIIWGDNSADYVSNSFTTPLTHTYATGNYTLTYTVTGADGCVNTIIYYVFVGSNPAVGLNNPGNTEICTGSSLTFPITGAESNPPQTTYTVTTNDGTNPVYFQHPPPTSVTHKFDKTSCGTSSPNYANSFSVTIQASNPCLTSSAIVIPIYVSERAEPEIKVSPRDTVCINSNVVVSSSGILGKSIESGFCTDDNLVWTVSPSIGYTIGGSLGNDFGLDDPSLWTNGSSSLNLNFTKPGIYTFKLKIGNIKCGNEETTKTICVNSAPTAGFTTDVSTTGCAPFTIKTTNNSNHPECGTNQYTWTVSGTHSLSCDVVNPDYEFINSTDANSDNPQFRFNSPGTYTITLVNKFDPSGCSSPLFSKTITVNGKPKVSINTISSVCQGKNINPIATYSCNIDASTTYNWSFPNGLPALSTSAIPGAVSYSQAGNQTITLSVSNTCGTTTDTKSFAVNTGPVISVPASSAYCAGITTGAFALSSNPAATVNWTNDNTTTGLNSAGTSNINAFTTVNNTSSTQISNVTATATLSGCTGSNTFAITVYPKVNAPVATTPINYCIGQTASPLTAAAGNGNTLLWYSVANGGTASSIAPTPDVSIAGTTHYYVSQVSTVGNCEGLRTDIAVTVNAIPAFTATPTNPTTCGTRTGFITLNGLTANTPYTITYTKDGANQTASLTSDGGGFVILNNLSSGLYDDIVVTANNCPSTAAGPFSLSDPNPPVAPVLTNTGPLCSGNTLQLNATTNSIGTATWTWTGPNGFTNTLFNPSIPNVTTAASGDYFATVTINNCTSIPGKTTVVINPTPATPLITTNSPVCSGNTVNFTNTNSGTGVTYNWTGPNNFTSADLNPSIAGITLAAAGDYTVKATLGACSAQTVVPVVVNETPAIGSTSKTDPTQCASATGSITLSGLSATKTYTVSYTKNGTPASKTITADGNGNVLIDALTSGTYDNLQVAINNCSSNTIGPITLNDPNPPAAPNAGSNAPLCAGATLNLTASSNNSGTYAWSGPNGYNSPLQNPTIPDVAAVNAGTYTVTITVNNCISLPTSINVIVNSLAAAPAAATPVEYCINTAAVPLAATANNGGTLNWFTVANGGTALPSAPTPSTATVGSVFYYVSQTSTSGCEGARTAIEVITHTDAKAEFLPTKDTGCAPFVITPGVINLQPHPEANANYQWYANDVLIGSGTAFPSYTIQNDHDSVTIKLKALSLFGCKDDSLSQKFFTYQLPKPAFAASQTNGCGPLTIAFTNNTPQPQLFHFKWIFGNGQTSTDINPSPVIFATNPTYGDTIYHVVLLAYTTCDTITASTDILVKSKPKALFSPDKTAGCSPLPVRFANVSKGFGTGYQWFFGDGGSTTTNDTSSVQHTYTTGIQDTFYAKMVATNECGTDTATYAIVVSPNKVKLRVAVNGNQTTGCAPHTVQFINASSGANVFQWNFGDGNTLNTTKNIDTVTHIFLNGGTYNVVLFASNGCSDTTTTEMITAFDKPAAAYSAMPLSACIGDTVSFINQSQNFDGLQWQFGDAQGATLTNPQHAYTTAGVYNAVLVAQKQYANGTICSDTAIKSITIVDHLPGAFTATATVSTCVPFTVTFTNTTLPSVLTTWDFGNGSLDTGDVVTHTFVLPGNYNVIMQAKHPAGCLYMANKTITANGPAGSIANTPGYVCNNTPVRFEASTTNTDSIRWDFGDGLFETTTSLVVYHSYGKPGVFVPSAELISGNNCRVVVATNDTIKVDYLQAGFTTQQDVVCGTTTVHYNDTSHAFFGWQQWLWKLGDGTTSSLQNPVHAYTATGTLPIQLIVISYSGCADTANVSLFIKVNDKPVASINGAANACDLLPVAYSAIVSSIDSISLYQWSITPNAAYNTPNIIHTYPSAGNYGVQLIAGTTYGCYDTASLTVAVKTTPLVTAGADAVICAGATTPLTVIGNAPQYQWQPGASLSCTTCANPLAAPVLTTQYYVTGTAGDGCSRTDSVLITVIQPFTLTVSAGDSICIGQSKQLTVSGTDDYVWSPAATLDDLASQHPVATPLASTTYSVTGTDAHHCFTDTKTVVVGVGQYPVISLGKDTLLSTGTIFPLHSVVTEGGPIKSYTWSPSTNLSCTNCMVPDANVKRPVCYSVDAANYFGCVGSDTVCIKVFCEKGQLFIANIFTPDGDGVNDKLVVQGKGISLIRSFRIFNRWGQVVYEKAGFAPNDASSGWDGRVNGNLASPDVYVYTCEVVCDDGTVYTYKGNTALVK